jgi:hypothetical protein
LLLYIKWSSSISNSFPKTKEVIFLPIECISDHIGNRWHKFVFNFLLQ